MLAREENVLRIGAEGVGQERDESDREPTAKSDAAMLHGFSRLGDRARWRTGSRPRSRWR